MSLDQIRQVQDVLFTIVKCTQSFNPCNQEGYEVMSTLAFHSDFRSRRA